MKRKIFIVAATLSLICVTGVLAQEPAAPATPPTPPTPEQIAQAKAERLTKRLNLTDEQSRKVYDVCLKNTKEQQALFKKMMDLRKDQAEKMKSILTDEQFTEWSQMQQQRPGMGPRDRKHERHHDGRMAPGPRPGKDAPEPRE